LGLWFRGIDLRLHGSKNIGATNTLRVLGAKMGLAALLADVLKGVVSVLVFSRISNWDYSAILCGVLAVVGHTFSVFLRFRGGKGVATSAGVFLALCPIPVIVASVVFGGTVAISRIVSLGSCLAALTMTLLVFTLPKTWLSAPLNLLPEPYSLRIIVSVVALLIIVKHRSNITRMLQGKENKISFSRKEAPNIPSK